MKLRRQTHSQGSTVPGIDLVIPEAIRWKFAAGWAEHVPSTYLTDSACQRMSALKVLQEALAFNKDVNKSISMGSGHQVLGTCVF